MGVDTIVGPNNTEAYIQQAELVTESQERVEPRLRADDIGRMDDMS